MDVRLDAKIVQTTTESFLEDEYGWQWTYSDPKAVDGMLLAETKGLEEQDIHGYYKEGRLFIATFDDAASYFKLLEHERATTALD